MQRGGTLTPFVGRRRELGQLVPLLREHRLITLTGPGGVGKTRLAWELGPEAVAVDLSVATTQEQAVTELLAALRVGEEPGRTPLDTALGQLGDSRTLVVLDNCEHLLDAAASLAQSLLVGCPNVVLLATSRRSLQVPGEVVWAVSGLSLDEDGDAAALFAACAARSAPALALKDPASRDAIARLCTELEGLPLAIELAAARLRVLTPEQLADRIANRMDVLGSGPRQAPERQQTLRASMEWSHEMLDERERRWLRRLAVFAGGWSEEDAQAVCPADGDPADDPLDVMAQLIDHSLVVADQDSRAARYRMLETVRQFALEQLEAAGEHEALAERHLAHYAAFTARVDLELRISDTGREEARREEPNIRAALDRGLETSSPVVLRMISDLTRWWVEQARLSEGRALCERGLELAERLPDVAKAEHALVYWGHGCLGLLEGDAEVVGNAMFHGLELAEASEDPLAIGRALVLWTIAVGHVAPAEAVKHGLRAIELLDDDEAAYACAPLATAHLTLDDLPEAIAVAERGVAAADAVGHGFGAAAATLPLCVARLFGGELEESNAQSQRVMALTAVDAPYLCWLGLGFRMMSDALLGRAAEVRDEGYQALDRARTSNRYITPIIEWGLGTVELALGNLDAAAELAAPGAEAMSLTMVAYARTTLGLVAVARGDVAGMEAQADACEELGKQLQSPRMDALAAYLRGRAALAGDRRPVAREHLDAALALHEQAGAMVYVPETLEAFAAATDNHAMAARLLAAASAWRDGVGAVRVPAEEDWLLRTREAVQDALSTEEWANASAAGASMTLREAIAYARRGRGPRTRADTGLDSLTPIEREVADLVADGLTNAEIGERLFVSRSTVKSHLRAVFAKLDVTTRAQVARSVSRDESAHP